MATSDPHGEYSPEGVMQQNSLGPYYQEIHPDHIDVPIILNIHPTFQGIDHTVDGFAETIIFLFSFVQP